MAGNVEGKHRSPIGDDGHQPNRPVPPPLHHRPRRPPPPARRSSRAHHTGHPAEGALVDGLLVAVAEQLGRPLPARLQAAFRRVPRHWFLPDRIWLRDGSGGYQPVDRATEPDGWLAAAYSDEPLGTRLTDGLPSSSASMPSMVARMLLLAGLTEPHARDDARARVRVLELGAGTRHQRAGEPEGGRLRADGRGRGRRLGLAAECPYNVVLSTFSVDRIPSAWLAQLRPGGRIVTPGPRPGAATAPSP